MWNIFHIWKFHMWSVPIPHILISHVKFSHVESYVKSISHMKISHVKYISHMKISHVKCSNSTYWFHMWNFRKGALHSFSDTRWTARTANLEVLLNVYPALLSMFQELSEQNTDSVTTGLHVRLIQFRFL